MKHKLLRAALYPLGLVIGIAAALLLVDAMRRVNPTVAVIVTLCAVVSVLAWRRGRWIL